MQNNRTIKSQRLKLQKWGQTTNKLNNKPNDNNKELQRAGDIQPVGQSRGILLLGLQLLYRVFKRLLLLLLQKRRARLCNGWQRGKAKSMFQRRGGRFAGV
jgi:hypothetical protein